MKIERKAKTKESICINKRGKEKRIIVVMASRRRAMKELAMGRVTFSPDTTSGGGSPRDSLEKRDSLERKIVLLNI